MFLLELESVFKMQKQSRAADRKKKHLHENRQKSLKEETEL